MTPTSTEIDRKSLKRPDQFEGNLKKGFDNLSKHTGGLIVLGVVILAAGVAGSLYMSQREAKAERARDALFKARHSLEVALTAMAEAEKPAADKATDKKPDKKDTKAKDAKAPAKPAPADGSLVAHKKLDVDSKLAETVANYKDVITEYGDTRAGFEARLGLGDLYFDHGQPEKAVPWYQGAVDKAPAKLERAFAVSALGYAYENSGKYTEAVKTYQQGLALGELSVKGDLLLAIARSFEAMKDSNQARGTYDQILSQLPNTEYAKSAEILKSQLE
jgi:tetratricopeptide (TPR) repeat protein